ncbi:GABA permease [Marinomonas spartinae]|uniref:amino acid permease n=1 Tax=Marinomonas spartinae TaxID=1792290 RepID=UPI000808D18D|nr:amino acid permease [Marinomonas spartinae]SBS32912.1 GABA permease [Marinomonas spartinae]
MSKANTNHLGAGLSNRQVSMISIAGIIGAGLFVGSANAIATTGPAILISYAMTGVLVLLVMRMLGEMAVSNPDSGSFSTYASRSIGPWAGFTIGWLYWWFWVLVIPVEAIAGANILHTWFQNIPSWEFAVGIMVILTLSNLWDVKSFGEFEFWFALIKVVAIIAFIIIGGMAIFGVWPLAKDVSGVANLYSHGGFMPKGFGTVLAGVLVTIFSFFGAEIVTIAAAESKNPGDKIRQATKLVVYRIALFYLLSIFVVVSLVAWNDPALKSGSFQFVLSSLHLPHAKLLVDIVVLTAVCSCMNSGLYTASRMFYSLACRGDAPAVGRVLSITGVPRVAVIASTLAGFVGCFASYVFPGEVFSFLLSTTGAIALVVYLVIAVSQLRMRNALEKEGKSPEFKMWLFPGLTWLTIGIIVVVLGYMCISPDYRPETFATVGVTAIMLIFSFIVTGKRSTNSNLVTE